MKVLKPTILFVGLFLLAVSGAFLKPKINRPAYQDVVENKKVLQYFKDVVSSPNSTFHHTSF